MLWQDKGIVMNVRTVSDRLTTTNILTEHHGLHKGAVRKKNQVHQGSFVHCRWQARLEEHLGSFELEETLSFPYTRHSYNEENKINHLDCVASILSLLILLLPERLMCREVFLVTKKFLYRYEKKDTLSILQDYWSLEHILLKFLGSNVIWLKCHTCLKQTNLEFFDTVLCSIMCSDHKTNFSIPFSLLKLKETSPLHQAKQWLLLNDLLFKHYLDLKSYKSPIAKDLLLKRLKLT